MPHQPLPKTIQNIVWDYLDPQEVIVTQPSTPPVSFAEHRQRIEREVGQLDRGNLQLLVRHPNTQRLLSTYIAGMSIALLGLENGKIFYDNAVKTRNEQTEFKRALEVARFFLSPQDKPKTETETPELTTQGAQLS